MGIYRQLEFCDGEYLIALTFKNSFFLEIWNWRNQTELLIQQTDFFIGQQFMMYDNNININSFRSIWFFFFFKLDAIMHIQ